MREVVKFFENACMQKLKAKKKKITKFEESWLCFVDWSRMKKIWSQISKDKQKIILQEGYWSEGKGKFKGDNPNE